MDEKELQAVSEALDQLRNGGTVTAETLAKLGGTTQSVNKAMQSYSQMVLKGTTAIGGMARAVADGEGSFKSLGGAITGLTSVVGKLASALPLVGGAAKALAEGVGEAAKFVLDQLDTMAKNYEALGDASAGAADGVDGLLRQFNQMGNYSLPAFTKAVRANTTGLAALSGTAAKGAEELSLVAGALTTGDMANRFLKLGIGLEKVGDTTVQYLSDFSRLGLTQGMTTTQLIKSSQSYILELDKLARITGQTREAAQQEQQRSMIDVAYRAKMIQLEQEGRVDEAKQLALFVNNLTGPMAEAARAQIAGIPATKEGALANLFMNDAMRENIIAVQNGKKASEALNDVMYQARDSVNTFSNQALYGQESFGGVYAQAADMASIINKEGKTRQERLADIDAAMQKQMDATGKTTQEFVNAQLATAGASKDLQSLGFSLATFAVPAVNKFATALEKVTGFINQNLGVGGTGSTPAGVSRGSPGGPRATAGLNPQLSSAVQGAMAEYTAMTGRTATITSTVRSREEQQRLYDAYIARGRTGMPAAPPGTSKHELGNAVDINRAAADEMDRLGILGRHGLSRPVPGDPVHLELSGPSMRHRSSLSGVNPASAGAETTALGQKTREEQQGSSNTEKLIQALDRLNRTNEAQLAVDKKILARQQ